MKKMWIWGSVVLLIAVGFYVFLSSKKLIIDHNSQPLDVKYSDLQEINGDYNSDIFEVRLIAEVEVTSSASPNPIRIFPSVNGQLILECDAKVDDETSFDYRYYKIDRTGVVTDSIYSSYSDYQVQFIDDFMVYTSDKDGHYTTWPLNGDTTKRRLVELNTDLIWADEKVEAMTREINKSAKYWFSSSFGNDSVWYRKTYFYADGKWKLLWQKLLGYTNLSDEESGNRYRKDVFRSGEVGFEMPKDVRLLYFYPEDKMKYHHIIGGGAGGFSVYNWRGQGFFETNVAGKNFRFKVPRLVVEKEKYNGFRPSLYTVSEAGGSAEIYNPAFYHSPNGFSFYSPNSQQMFIIKMKRRQLD